MKLKELKEILNNYNEEFDIYIRNSNGSLETNKIRIIQIHNSNQNSYLIDA